MRKVIRDKWMNRSLDNTVNRPLELAGVVLLLLLAAWLYWRLPLEVPPGLEMDELIEAQIAEQVLQGDWRLFYPAGQGREGLYHYWLAGWLTLLGKRVFTLRIASSTLSLFGLAAGYLLIRYLFGSVVALVGLALSATTFWTLFAARSGLRSSSLPLLIALAGYFFWRGITREFVGGRNRFLLAAAFCLGLTFYAYTAARVLPGIFVLFILYLRVFHRFWLFGRRKSLLLAAVVTLLMVLPLLLYLQSHPEVDQFDFLEFNRPLAALESGDPEPALRTSLVTLGLFNFRGDPLIFDNVPDRPVFSLFGSLFFWAGLLIALVRFRRPAYAFVLLWLSTSLLPGMLSHPAPNFYRTVAAQGVAFCFPGLALAELALFVRRRWAARPVLLLLSVGLTLMLVVVQLVGTWQAYFTTWPTVEGVSFFWQRGLAQAARYLDGASGSDPVALCTVLTYERDPWWRPAWQSMPYLLNRRDLAIRYYDCRTTLVIPAAGPVRYLFPDNPDPGHLMPAEFQSGWLAGVTPISGVFSPGQGVALRVDSPPSGLGPEAGTVWWAPKAGGELASLPVQFGSSLALLGYHRTPTRPMPGEPLRLVTAWEVLATPPPRLALFTHLLSDPQTLVAQQDSLALSSHSLRAGDRFLVLHDQVMVPVESAADRYLVSIGLYSSDTMARLPIWGGQQRKGDHLFLEPVEVELP